MPETKAEYNRRKRKDNAAKRKRNKEAFASLGITQARFNELVKEAKDNGAIIVGFKIVREGADALCAVGWDCCENRQRYHIKTVLLSG